ncbi:hypothetical protein [Paludisphaera mucosa]|uniref:Squalene cyclase C-terminal domain-containing protein n=1 Tax=Paludisphaera mucosa TaxID=3030827 RepID=A0ABT6FCY3_9BACT|nr:hypothetical protein [Paludisphaera mucosa]MDG3005215.1 hypothetical protein [Paludisphaera mucosa]
MTGLDLESFLLLLKADLGAWALVALGCLMLAILVWVSWGSRQAIRKCLAMSIAAHAALLLGGSSVPAVMRALNPQRAEDDGEDHIRRIRVSPVADPETAGASAEILPFASLAGRPARSGPAPVDRLDEPVDLAAPRVDAARPEPAPAAAIPEPTRPPPLAIEGASPAAPAVPQPSAPEEAPRPADATPQPPEAIAAVGDETLNAPDVPAPEPAPEAESPRGNVPLAGDARIRTSRPRTRPEAAKAESPAEQPALPPLALATPRPAPARPAAPPLADLSATPRAPITEVPRIYRSRLDADRSARAQRAGASPASEQAVERALDWLARHQDADGRWDGGTARFEDGEVVEGDDDYTVHCPAGQTCFGECAYWEADTGLTALALLTYLGAGYTHKEGKYAATVSKGLGFLLRQQKPDGDLRGVSKTVGMYCHAMATLALCEAYALSLDDRLRTGAERAVGFLGRSRARDGLSWRYAPGAPAGDTSILGWVVMALKSAREIGVPIADQASLEKGAATWLERVADGDAKGLGKYQPWEGVTPTMTAEAWACRQFLGLGGPGPASSEAAAYLLKHESDKGGTNVYYWYYATLAMYQHGGRPWAQWNDRVRNRLVSLQRTAGHQAGSWDPDDSVYGARGGRIYCTTLAALTLEVYYRYLRLYDKPSLPEDLDDEPLPDPAPDLDAPVAPGRP